MPTFTVTGRVSSPLTGFALRVLVVTGVSETGGAKGVANGYAVPQVPVTPAQSGSLIVFGACLPNVVTTMTAASGNTFLDGNLNASGDTDTDGYYSGTVTGGTPVTVGASAPSGDYMGIAAYELVPSGTPAIDPSTPVVAVSRIGGNGTVTTVPFTPPGNSVLVAIVMFNNSSTSLITVTDTSRLGLAWTARAVYDGTGFSGGAAVYTAPLPSSAGKNTSVVYASSYNIVAGGAGSWSNPANSEGAPDGSYATWQAP